MLYGDYMTPPPPGDRELVHCDPKFVTLSYSEKGEKIHDRKAAKSKIRLTPICGDMVYSLAGLMILNMTLSFWGISVFKKPYGC